MKAQAGRRTYSGLEAGGRSFCAVGRGQTSCSPRTDPTTTRETIGRPSLFRKQSGLRPHRIGIGTFGPVDLDPTSRGSADHFDAEGLADTD
jgi:hypothetical protein